MYPQFTLGMVEIEGFCTLQRKAQTECASDTSSPEVKISGGMKSKENLNLTASEKGTAKQLFF